MVTEYPNATFSFKVHHESKVVAPEPITRKPCAWPTHVRFYLMCACEHWNLLTAKVFQGMKV